MKDVLPLTLTHRLTAPTHNEHNPIAELVYEIAPVDCIYINEDGAVALEPAHLTRTQTFTEDNDGDWECRHCDETVTHDELMAVQP